MTDREQIELLTLLIQEHGNFIEVFTEEKSTAQQIAENIYNKGGFRRVYMPNGEFCSNIVEMPFKCKFGRREYIIDKATPEHEKN